MGRAKLEIKKIKEYGPRQGAYTNRKRGVVKKADELSILCNIDVVLTMFSPAGRPTTFASNGRSEEIYLRYFRRPESRRGHVLDASPIVGRLKCLKRERELMETISRREALKKEINLINEKVKDTSDKLRSCFSSIIFTDLILYQVD
ncbi:agamous-like MADS-box protein AGL104 [Papaver somniferum]|uniref:agamous-like MADS-box protein AGL104 n=1 Tax=Papaver somniferum TaxID=3469 RepID=UPI000E6F81BC|nr:agamous-like MADS-box protein AGL104 [Papaver somniferum]